MKKNLFIESLESHPPIYLGENASLEGIGDIFKSLAESWRKFLDGRLMKRNKLTSRDLQRLANSTFILRRHVAKSYAHPRWIELRYSEVEQYTISNSRALYIGDKIQDNSFLTISDKIYDLNRTLELAADAREKYVFNAMNYLLGNSRNGIHITKGQLIDFYAQYGHIENVLSKLDRKFPAPAPMGHLLHSDKGYLKYQKLEKIPEEPITRRGMTLAETQDAGKQLLRLLDSVISCLDSRRYGILKDDYEYLVQVGYEMEKDSEGNVEEKFHYENLVPEVLNLAKSIGDNEIIQLFSYEEWNRKHGDAMYQTFDFALEAIQVIFDSVNQHLK